MRKENKETNVMDNIENNTEPLDDENLSTDELETDETQQPKEDIPEKNFPIGIFAGLFVVIIVIAVGIYMTLPWLNADEKDAYKTATNFVEYMGTGKIGKAFELMDFYHFVDDYGADQFKNELSQLNNVSAKTTFNNCKVKKVTKKVNISDTSIQLTCQVLQKGKKGELIITLNKYNNKWYVKSIRNPKNNKGFGFGIDDILSWA